MAEKTERLLTQMQITECKCVLLLFTHPPLTRRGSRLDEIHILTGQQAVSYLINTAIDLCKGLRWLVPDGKIKIYLTCDV